MENTFMNNFEQKRPSIDLRSIFLLTATILSIIGFLLNFFLIYLIFFKTPKNMSQYKIILIQNCFIDILFNIVNDICKVQTDYKNGSFFFIGSDLLKYIGFPGNFILTLLWFFTIFFCVTSIPVQFVYRYYIIVREETFTKFKYFLLSMVAIFGASSAAVCTGYTFWPEKNLIKEKSLLLKNDIYYYREIPMFFVAEIQHWPLLVGCGYALILVTVTYIITIVASFKVWKKLKSQILFFSPQTKRMHNQMTKTMILQAIVPLILILIPIGTAVIATFAYEDVPGLGMILNIFCCWIPVANPLVTIISIKVYRIAIIKWFRYCFRKWNKKVSPIVVDVTSLKS